jgi:hypothetical protein
MFAKIQRLIARFMAPLAHELARIPATAQRNLLIGF